MKKEKPLDNHLYCRGVSLFFVFIFQPLQYGDGQACHYYAYHRHQLDEDVEGGAGGVLEGIAYGVAYDGGSVSYTHLTLPTN